MSAIVICWCGWLGFMLCASGYLLLNIKVLKFDGVWFQLLNTLGGLGLLISAAYHTDLPNIASNTIWVLIGVFGLARFVRWSGSRKRG